jgi:methanethiol S-methyltransferase
MKRKYNKKIILIRILAILIFLVPLLFFNDFYTHIYAHFMGNIKSVMVLKQWQLVLLNIIAFSAFLIPLSFRRTINWKEYGLVTAFFISLFVEMYGIPLTIYFSSKYFSPSLDIMPTAAYSINFFGTDIAMTKAMIYGIFLMLIGTSMILIGWITLYRNIGEKKIVTNGIYSYSRHPQYVGFILIIFGWLVGWPTLITTIFAPLLIVMYIRLCFTEEKELSTLGTYRKYKLRVPFLI